MTEKANGSAKKIRSQRKLIVALLTVLLFVLAVGAGLLMKWVEQNRTPEYEVEVKAKLGQLEGKSEAEVQAELNRVIEEGMFHISINTDPGFYTWDSEGNLEIENVPNNHYLMRVEIVREDTGETVFSTKYIEPNSYIQRAPLDKELAAGDYPCLATFYAYEPGSLAQMGSVSTRMTVHILH